MTDTGFACILVVNDVGNHKGARCYENGNQSKRQLYRRQRSIGSHLQQHEADKRDNGIGAYVAVLHNFQHTFAVTGTENTVGGIHKAVIHQRTDNNQLCQHQHHRTH